MNILLGILVVFLVAFGVGPAAANSANDASPDASPWVLADYRIVRAGNGSVIDSGYALYTASQTVPGAIFYCFNKRLYAGYSATPVNMRDVAVDQGPTRRTYVRWAIGDEKPARERWMRVIKHKTLVARDQTTTRRLYNAAVRGDRVTIESKSYGDVVVTLPEAAPGRFNDFTSKCGFAPKSEGA